ncbi:hypothetical protein ACFL0R_07050 [Pseudomonadota bacterium]
MVPTLVGVVATITLFPFAGLHSLWLLTTAFMGIIFYFIYGAVGRRVASLKTQFQGEKGELTESLLVIGNIQSPGVVILRKSEVELAPIVGRRCAIPLDQITAIKEGGWLPGKYVWGKRAFILTASTAHPKRLAFAVPESIGERWSVTLNYGARNRHNSYG